MKNNDNPFPKLAEQLADLFPERQPANLVPWLNGVSKTFGGLWGLYGHDILPENLPPLNPPQRLSFVATFPKPKKLSFWQRLLRFIKSLLNWNNQEVEPRQAVAAKPQPDELADSLAECHDWLRKQNFRYLSSWFAPFWEEIPISEFAVVSEKSLAWRLVTEQGTLSNKTALDKKYHLDAGATLGDFLNMHIYIEEFIVQAQSHLKCELTPKPEYRKPGGLRTASFLNTYPVLIAANSWESKKWREKINILIEKSPITQIVYIDVIEKVFSQQEIIKSFTKLGPEIKSWHDLWLSHLAKSLVGGIFSPPPVFEQYQLAQKRCELLEEQIKKEEQIVQSPKLSYLRFKRQKAKEEFERLHRQMVFQYVDRLEKLENILCDSPYLHLRVLDMLLRHIVSSSIERIQKLRVENKLLPPQVRAELLSACFQSFESVLFGNHEWVDFLNNQEEQSEKLRENLRFFLQPSIPENPVNNLTRQMAVPADSIRRLLTRFRDNEVRVPFRQINDLGKSPITIFGGWFTTLSNRLSSDQVLVVESVEEIVEEI